MIGQLDTQYLRTRPWKLWPRLLAYGLFEGRPLTTRGRWINPLVFAGYRLWDRVPTGNPPTMPVFILGMGRCGTTILGKILSLHPDVGYLNEPKALWHAALGDEDVIGSYAVRPGRFRMGGGDAQSGRAERLRRFYRAYSRLSLSRRVVDKYPEMIFRTGLIDAAFPDARKIVLVRNGADTCASVQAWSGKNRTRGADWWGSDGRKWRLMVDQLVAPDPFFAPALRRVRAFTDDLNRGAVEWIVTMREARALSEAADGRTRILRYEDLVNAPAASVADILRFCRLAPDARTLEYASRVLAPRPTRAKPLLDDALQPLFDQTMAQWGYDAG